LVSIRKNSSILGSLVRQNDDMRRCASTKLQREVFAKMLHRDSVQGIQTLMNRVISDLHKEAGQWVKFQPGLGLFIPIAKTVNVTHRRLQGEGHAPRCGSKRAKETPCLETKPLRLAEFIEKELCFTQLLFGYSE